MRENPQVREIIQEMPEDVLSLTWRSQLNEKILVESARIQRRRKLSWWSRPAASLVLAGGLALVFLVRAPMMNARVADAPSIESTLLNVHRESQVSVTDVSLTSSEADEYGVTIPHPDGWTESDLVGI